MDAYVFQIIWEGQTSDERWKNTFYNYSCADDKMEQLKEENPEVEYFIYEKDVS